MSNLGPEREFSSVVSSHGGARRIYTLRMLPNWTSTRRELFTGLELIFVARANSRNLKSLVNTTVRLTCKVVQVKGDTATVEASDGGQIGVLLSRDMHLEDPYVEIIGLVKDDMTVKALTSINLGKKLAVNQVVELSHSQKGLGVFT